MSMFAIKKVIITGATSMVGLALINKLISVPSIEKIYAIVRPFKDGQFSKVRKIPDDLRIRIIECELKDYQTLSSKIDDTCDIFYHLAWPRTATYDETIGDVLIKCEAVKSVIMAIQAAQLLGCRKFVGAGSQSEYGIHPDGIYSVDNYCDPVRIDGILHLAAGQIGRQIAEMSGMIFIWMRIFSVYGTNDRENSMIMSTMDKLIKGSHCSFTKSEQTWDYVYESDVAEAFYLVGKKTSFSTTYNMASGISYPLKDYISILRDVIAPEAELGIGEISYPANPIMKMEVDVSSLTNDTGWMPKVSFEQGIRYIFESKLG